MGTGNLWNPADLSDGCFVESNVTCGNVYLVEPTQSRSQCGNPGCEPVSATGYLMTVCRAEQINFCGAQELHNVVSAVL